MTSYVYTHTEGDNIPEISMGSEEAKRLLDGVSKRIPQLRAVGGVN